MKIYLNIYFLIPLFIVVGVVTSQYYQYGKLPEVSAIEPPKLPASPAMLLESSLEDMLSNNLWDKDRGHVISKTVEINKAKEVTTVRWRLLAISGRANGGNVGMVEMTINGEKSWQTYSSGDLLPDASQVLEILNDGMIVENNGEKRNVYLFGKQDK